MKTSVLQGRPTVAEIDLRALTFNYRQIKKRIPRGVSILAVVKADAYGHGALPVSLRLEELGVEYLGVALPEEGVALRRGGVKTPILILGGFFQAGAEEILRYDLTPVAFDIESLKRLSKAAEKKRKNAKVHIKVDTGMSRLGIPSDHFPDFLKECRSLPHLEIEGLLSHFAMTDGEEVYTLSQWKKFQEAITQAKTMGITSRYIHMASSATSIAFPAYSGNLIRPGIMLYGSYPSPIFKDQIKLKPVLTLKTRIHFIKSVPAGTRISYGGTYITQRESRIATLPIGYADGYSIRLSNQGEVLIRGKRAAVVGRVCMDLIMVDVTDFQDVSVGEEVVLIGRQGNELITADEVAGKIGSIPYEVLCLIGKRVPRIYRGR